MKSIILLVIQFVATVSIIISPLWAIVEFILYLVKDKDFNWMSVWVFVVSLVVAVSLGIYGVVITNKNGVQSYRKKKSIFQERLEEARRANTNTTS